MHTTSTQPRECSMLLKIILEQETSTSHLEKHELLCPYSLLNIANTLEEFKLSKKLVEYT